MILTFLYIVVIGLALLPVFMFSRNLSVFLPLEPIRKNPNRGRVSVLIPARNEEKSIGAAIDSILESVDAEFEIVVLDDQSDDATADEVFRRSELDSRVRLVRSGGLPEGWNGKQHACYQLSKEARYEWLLFLDADVRLAPDAIARLVDAGSLRGVSLLSGFPWQETVSLGEKLLIPMMHYVLLSYLPIDRMRQGTDPSFSAGCGQLMLASRADYERCGGHSSIRSSRHDGIQLPKVFRQNGLRTDVFDATDIARCRMYSTTEEVVQGLLKNATEGIAQPKLIVIFSLLILGAGVFPHLLWLGLGWGVFGEVNRFAWIAFATLLVVMAHIPRGMAAVRFRQNWLGVWLHPLAAVWFVFLQWRALWRVKVGMPEIPWRGRSS